MGNCTVEEAHLVMYGSALDDKMGRYMNGLGDIDGDGMDDIGVVAHNSACTSPRRCGLRIPRWKKRGHFLVDFIVVGGTTNDYIGRAIFSGGRKRWL